MWREIVGSVGQARLKSHEPTARGPSRHTARVRASPSSRARVKNYYIPHPYGLDLLCLGPIMIIILLKIVEWSIEQYSVCTVQYAF